MTETHPPSRGGRPNVVIVLVDDQGYGDLSGHGNPVLRTPSIDRLRAESARLTDFHVAPVCTPTRSQLLSGLHCLANGAYAFDGGRALLRAGLTTLADAFAGAGYATGLFGKWHLGDQFPYRPTDRGFQEAVHHQAWGVTSVPDSWLNDYFDDRYHHNGAVERYAGYCTDVWFREARRWMRRCAGRGQPFLAYIATNAPHVPLFVPDGYREPYRHLGPEVASFYGMLACVDENVGRLDAFLARTGLRENTILVFLTDNGGTAGVPVFNAGMRGRKGDLYDGGHRVPCFLRWPAGGLAAPADVDGLTQCQDLLPTLLDLCDLGPPDRLGFRGLDGISLAPALRGRPQALAADLSERTLVVQYATHPSRGVATEWFGDPTEWDAAVLWGRWRLVSGRELYDLGADPGQTIDLAAEHPDVVACLRDRYEAWWAGVAPGAFAFEHVPLGSADPRAPEVVELTSQTWLKEPVAATFGAGPNNVRLGQRRNGPWNVRVERDGRYEITLRRWPAEADAPIAGAVPAYHGADATFGPFVEGVALPIIGARLRVGALEWASPVGAADTALRFSVPLAAGRTRLQTWFLDRDGTALCGAHYVTVRRLTEAEPPP